MLKSLYALYLPIKTSIRTVVSPFSGNRIILKNVFGLRHRASHPLVAYLRLMPSMSNMPIEITLPTSSLRMYGTVANNIEEFTFSHRRRLVYKNIGTGPNA